MTQPDTSIKHRKSKFHPFKNRNEVLMEALEMAIINCDCSILDSADEQHLIIEKAKVFKRLQFDIGCRMGIYG